MSLASTNLGNAYPVNTPKYCIDDVIDFLDNLYDVVFMTYEPNITAYGTLFGVLMVVPHDIDWVKDRVRWYWDNKIMKHRKSTATNAEGDVKTDASKADVKPTAVAA
jgi:hypothetical protein